jgi:hypothetical protein
MLLATGGLRLPVSKTEEMPIPDIDLYPEATGLAKKTADKHKDPQDLVLYSGWFCPFGTLNFSNFPSCLRNGPSCALQYQ